MTAESAGGDSDHLIDSQPLTVSRTARFIQENQAWEGPMKLSKLALLCIAATAICSPASATIMLAQWSGYVVSGSVNGPGDLAAGDYTGQAWTATFAYQSDPQPGQSVTDFGNGRQIFGQLGASPVTSASLTIGAVTMDIAPLTGMVLAGGNGNTGELENDASGFYTAGGNYYSRDLDLTATITSGAPGDLSSNFSGTLEGSIPLNLGVFHDCLQRYSGDGYCVDLRLKATGLSVIDPPAAVPEPSTWTLLLAGFGLLGSMVRAGNRTMRSARRTS